MSLLRSLAAGAPVPVFAAVGRDAAAAVDELSLQPGIECVASPRHATVLLVAGGIRAADHDALLRVHDQLPHPRATLWWGSEALDGVASPVSLAASDDPAGPLRGLYERLLAGERRSERHWLPDEPPAPWRGLGEHGQGGKGMMGGKPYGRPMAMTGDDLSDGLALDVFPVQVGPFLPTLPAGLVLELMLQGDVVQHAKVIRPPLSAGATANSVFRGVASDLSSHPDVASEVRRTNAAHALRCLARLLVLLGLIPQAERCRRAASKVVRGEPVDLDDLHRSLQRAGAFAAIPPGLGRLERPVAEALGGAALCAALHAGLPAAEQAVRRSSGPNEPVDGGGDVRDRMRQWLDDAERALRHKPSTGRNQPGETGSGARRPVVQPSADEPQEGVAFRFTDLLVGLEWNEAMLVISSFDAASLCRMSPSDEEGGAHDQTARDQAGHDHDAQHHARHDHAPQDQAARDHAGHEHAPHDHAGHHAGHDPAGNEPR